MRLDVEGLRTDLLADTSIGVLLQQDSTEDGLLEVWGLRRYAPIELHRHDGLRLLRASLGLLSGRHRGWGMLVELEDSEEGLLRDLYCTDLLHTLLPLLLLL